MKGHIFAKKAFGLVCATMLVFNLMACTTKKQNEQIEKVEGLESFGAIQVVSREDGSGTREVFVEKTGLLETDDSGKEVDLTTANATIKMDADAVIEAVAKDKTAIGYVSLGAINTNNENVKVVAINGYIPTSERISSDEYPLSRDLILAYSGGLTDAEKDFLSYIRQAGQKVVEEGYTPVKDSTSFLSDQSKGSIRINGSTSVAPLMESLIKDYKNYNSQITIELETSDSTSGLTAAMQDSCDLGMSSRTLKDYEKELLDYEVIAKDGVAVIVNKDNPVTTLTLSQLKEIFSGTDIDWVDINE